MKASIVWMLIWANDGFEWVNMLVRGLWRKNRQINEKNIFIFNFWFLNWIIEIEIW